MIRSNYVFKIRQPFYVQMVTQWTGPMYVINFKLMMILTLTSYIKPSAQISDS